MKDKKHLEIKNVLTLKSAGFNILLICGGRKRKFSKNTFIMRKIIIAEKLLNKLFLLVVNMKYTPNPCTSVSQNIRLLQFICHFINFYEYNEAQAYEELRIFQRVHCTPHCPAQSSCPGILSCLWPRCG